MTLNKTIKKIALAIMALTLSLGLLTACGQTDEQLPSTANSDTFKIGLIQLTEHPSLDQIRESFVAEIDSLGYGDKIQIDYQNGQNDPTTINSICQKFVGDKVDLIVAIATPAAQGAASATKGTDIPVIFSAITDPIEAGLLENLETPEGQITGISDRIPVDQIFNLAKELTPEVKSYGFVYSLGEPNSASVIKEAKALLDSLNIPYKEAVVTNVGEVAQATQSLVGKVDAFFLPIDNTVASAMPNVAEIAINAKMPVYVSADSMVNDGGLASVGVNYVNLGKQTAAMVVKNLTGTAINGLPVEVLTEYNTVVNPDTAAALGIDVSKYNK